jgi:hypothetical protein
VIVPRLIAIAALIVLTGCSTRIHQLELQRDQLLRIEAATGEVRRSAEAGRFDPATYDAYLLLNRSVFDTLMAAFDNTTVEVMANGRPIDFTVSSMRLGFRPGHPDLTLAVVARDRQSRVEANVDLDARLLFEWDSAAAGPVHMRVVATRIVPRVRWGMFDFTRRAFVRRMLALEATRFTERLPRITLPVSSEFEIGGPARTQVITLPAGEATITGNISFPATQQKWAVSVEQILSLTNGVHIFANLEANR